MVSDDTTQCLCNVNAMGSSGCPLHREEPLDARLQRVEEYIDHHALDRCGASHRASAQRHDAHDRDMNAVADEPLPAVRVAERNVVGGLIPVTYAVAPRALFGFGGPW